MKRKTAGRSAEPRRCAFCGGLMPADKPVFLVMSTLGGIVGPYHSGCAYKVAEEHKGVPTTRSLPGLAFGRRVPEAREETLPW